MAQARESLTGLLAEQDLPEPIRRGLQHELAQVQAMLDKLEHGHLHIAVFGRVGVGKSALLNALMSERRFSSSPLHGETKDSAMAAWREYEADGVYFIDTPGINEVEGEARERIAQEAAGRADLVLFVVEGDLSDTELTALRRLLQESRPLLVVFNKTDRYTAEDRAKVLESLRVRTEGLVPAENVLEASADPAERVYIQLDAEGHETETRRQPPPQVADLKERLWQILEREGKSLAAVNATLFAGRLSDTLAARIVEVKRDVADQVIRKYSLAKGMVVGVNPVPVTDLAAAVTVDVSLIVHLSRVYGLPVTRAEAGGLMRTIFGQMALLMGTVWTIHLFSSALKVGTVGVSTVVTGAAQGAVAYYSTYVVGRAAQRYFAQGKSWGEQGPKRVVQEILDSVDRGSLLAGAREEILMRLRSAGQNP